MLTQLPLEAMALCASLSAFSSLLIILLFNRNSKFLAKRSDLLSVQAAHYNPTARIGGLAIVSALLFGVMLFYSADILSAPVLVLASALPVFCAGLSEDLGYFASPRRRLLAAAMSGAVFIGVTGQWILSTDIPWLDIALQWSPFAVGFSLFLAVGISHAFNLIDGLNGLAGFTAASAALALALIAHQSGLSGHRDILLIVFAAIFGFLIFNFPFGKIFLGDAGAYAIGHFLVWMSISILWSAPNITAFAMFLIFFWPIADTLLAIWRRVSRGRSIAQPDRLHFHQMVMRGVEIVVLGRQKRRIANPLSVIFMLPFIISPMIAGVLLVDDWANAALACSGFTVLFFMTYKTGIWLAPKFRLSARPKSAKKHPAGHQIVS